MSAEESDRRAPTGERAEAESTASNGRETGDVGTEETERDSMAEDAERGAATAASETAADRDPTELRAELEALRLETSRLRRSYSVARRSAYRRSALSLLGVGGLAVAAAIAFPTAREVLFVIGAIGLFGGVLTYFLTPERLVPAVVDRSIYDAVEATGEALTAELGLSDLALYVPVDAATDVGSGVRLFVPQSSRARVAADDALSSLFVAPDDAERRGVALHPTGARLLGEFRRGASGGVADEPRELIAQLCDALVEQFELVSRADFEVDADADADAGRITVAVGGGEAREATSFDHPVASFLACGLADGLDVPVELERTRDGDRVLLTFRWITDERTVA